MFRAKPAPVVEQTPAVREMEQALADAEAGLDVLHASLKDIRRAARSVDEKTIRAVAPHLVQRWRRLKARAWRI